jgi:serine/threonine protein kinase
MFLPKKQFDIDYGTKKKVIGNGSYGSVYTTENPQFVVKQANLEGSKNELVTLANLDTLNHVVNLLAYSIHEEDVFLAFTKYVGDVSSIRVPNTKKFFYQVCLGIAEMHCKNTAHLDLKPQNILVDAKANYYVADFSLSVCSVLCPTNRLPPSNMVATYSYRPPEIWLKQSYGLSVDVWSLAILFIETSTGTKFHTLFEQDTTEFFELFGVPSESEWPSIVQSPIYKSIKKIKKNEKLANMLEKSEIRELVEWMLQLNPSRRPSILDVLNHKYFDSVRNKGDIPINSCNDVNITSILPAKCVGNDHREKMCGRLYEITRKLKTGSDSFVAAIATYDRYVSYCKTPSNKGEMLLLYKACHYLQCDLRKQLVYDDSYESDIIMDFVNEILVNIKAKDIPIYTYYDILILKTQNDIDIPFLNHIDSLAILIAFTPYVLHYSYVEDTIYNIAMYSKNKGYTLENRKLQTCESDLLEMISMLDVKNLVPKCNGKLLETQKYFLELFNI